MANNRNRTSPAQRQAPVRAGDATGRTQAALQREHAKEIAAAAQTTTLVNPPRNMIEDNDTVTDYSSGQPVEVPLQDVYDAGDTVINPDDLPMGEIDMDSLPSGQVEPGFVAPQLPKDEPEAAHQRPLVQEATPVEQRPVYPTEALDDSPQTLRLTREEWAALEDQRFQDQMREPVRQQPAPRVVEKFVTMRVNTDLEDVTIGVDKNYTFEAGRLYKVPESVFNHLKEKGYVNY